MLEVQENIWLPSLTHQQLQLKGFFVFVPMKSASLAVFIKYNLQPNAEREREREMSVGKFGGRSETSPNLLSATKGRTDAEVL